MKCELDVLIHILLDGHKRTHLPNGILPRSDLGIETLVVPPGFGPGLRVSKTPVQPIHHRTILLERMTRQGIEPRANDDSDIRFRLFTSHPFASSIERVCRLSFTLESLQGNQQPDHTRWVSFRVWFAIYGNTLHAVGYAAPWVCFPPSSAQHVLGTSQRHNTFLWRVNDGVCDIPQLTSISTSGFEPRSHSFRVFCLFELFVPNLHVNYARP